MTQVNDKQPPFLPHKTKCPNCTLGLDKSEPELHEMFCELWQRWSTYDYSAWIGLDANGIQEEGFVSRKPTANPFDQYHFDSAGNVIGVTKHQNVSEGNKYDKYK